MLARTVRLAHPKSFEVFRTLDQSLTSITEESHDGGYTGETFPKHGTTKFYYGDSWRNFKFG